MKFAAIAILLAAVVLAGGVSLLAQDGGAPGRAAKLYEMHMYDVRDLVVTVPDYPAQFHMDLVPSGGFGFGMFEEEEPALLAYYEGDLLVDLIRRNVAPASWEELRSVSIWYTNGILSVRHTKAVHGKVADLLAALRKRVSAQIMVTAEWVRISDGTLSKVLGDGSRFHLDEAAGKRLSEARTAGDVKVVAAGSVLCSNTQRVAITDVVQVSYVQDYDVEIAQKSQIPDPIVQIATEGVVADVRPTIAGRGEVVVLQVRADTGKLSRPIESIKTEVGSIETPSLDLQKIRTTVAVPAGRTAVIGGTLSGMDGDGLLLLIRVELVR
ncbi:MAG: hypothetical protein ABFS86_03960 [Planctomycetota bacterium]